MLRRYTKVCAWCHKAFSTPDKRRTTCGSICAAKKAGDTQKRAERKTLTCTKCGATFIRIMYPARRTAKRTYCPRKCQRANPSVLPVGQILLTKGRIALVDPEDHERVAAFSWYYKESRGGGYARRRAVIDGKIKSGFKMENFILNLPQSIKIDHVNRNGIDNRKENMRPCTQSQNAINIGKLKRKQQPTSIYKGVFHNRQWDKWDAKIQVRHAPFFLGSFKNEPEAARTYDAAAQHYFGEFAYLNLPIAELPGC